MIGRLGCSGIFAILTLTCAILSRTDFGILGWVLLATGLMWIGSTLAAPHWQFRVRALFCFCFVASLVSSGLDFGNAFWSVAFGWWGINSWKQGVAANWAFDELTRERIAPFEGERHAPQPITPTPLTPAALAESAAEFASDSLVAQADESPEARDALATTLAKAANRHEMIRHGSFGRR